MMIVMMRLRLCLCIVTLLGNLSAVADEVLLRNGSEFSGRLVEDTGSRLVFELEQPPGTVAFPYEEVVLLNGVRVDLFAALRRRLVLFEQEAQRILEVPLPGSLRAVALSQEESRPEVLRRAASGLSRENQLRDQAILSWLTGCPATFFFSPRYASWIADYRTAFFDRATGEVLLFVAEQPASLAGDPFWEVLGRTAEEVVLMRAALSRIAWGTWAKGAPVEILAGRALAQETALAGVVTVALADWLLGPEGAQAYPPAMLEEIGLRLHAAARTWEPGMETRVPAFFWQRDLVPWTQGARWVHLLRSLGGWELVLRSLPEAAVGSANPAGTTEPLVDPENTLLHPEEPGWIDFGQLELPGWKLLEEGSLGFWQIGALMGEAASKVPLAPQSSAFASSWQADTYRIYVSDPGESAGWIWQSVWKNEEEAIRFFRAVRGWLSSRYDWQKQISGREDLTARLQTEKEPVHLERTGSLVLLAEGFPEAILAAVIQKVGRQPHDRRPSEPFVEDIEARLGKLKNRWAFLEKIWQQGELALEECLIETEKEGIQILVADKWRGITGFRKEPDGGFRRSADDNPGRFQVLSLPLCQDVPPSVLFLASSAPFRRTDLRILHWELLSRQKPFQTSVVYRKEGKNFAELWRETGGRLLCLRLVGDPSLSPEAAIERLRDLLSKLS